MAFTLTDAWFTMYSATLSALGTALIVTALIERIHTWQSK